MKEVLAPIVLFVYDRENHLRQTIDSLLLNDLSSQSDLIIFSDGPKNVEDEIRIIIVRNYIKTISGFKSITIIERDKNLGLAQSIVTGVNEVIEKYGKIIVLEDDLLLSKYFLRYMNDGLNEYENDERVISIHGYIYPVAGELPQTFFIKGADCLGWATWKRGWNFFEKDGLKLLRELKDKNLTHRFDFNGAYPYTQMLQDQIDGKISSWAIRWLASAFINNKLTLYPGKSLVFHNGSDGSGTHCQASNVLDVVIADECIKVGGIDVCENEYSWNKIRKYFLSTHSPKKRIASLIKKNIKYLFSHDK